MTDATDSPPATKPGYKTTEFWLKVAALLLTALFASGAIPTSGPAATITAIAATMLGALGYTVSRSFVKAAGILLVIALAGASMTACTAARPALAAGVVAALDCEAAHLDAQALADAKLFASAEVQHWLSGAGAAPSSAVIKADLAPIKSDLGRCAIAGALAAAAALVAPAPGTAVSALLAAGPDPAQARVAFQLAARELGWPPVRLAGGTVL